MNKEFSIFIAKSLAYSSFDDKFNFGLITNTARLKIKYFTGLNFENFNRSIDSSHIRHIKNHHPQDLHILNNIEDVLNNFDYARKSITKGFEHQKKMTLLKLYRNPLQMSNQKIILMKFTISMMSFTKIITMRLLSNRQLNEIP